MEDALIVAGTALVGGLAINLQRRVPAYQLIGWGAALLTLGWIAALIMSASGPWPSPLGAAVGTGLLLTGILLIIPAWTRTRREG